jgi:polygalacturonase
VYVNHAGQLRWQRFGAVGDGKTLNTGRIQSAIDQLVSQGGGTLVIPGGVFLSGAIFLKPGVNLHLEEGAVLKGSTDIRDYPKARTRIEGRFVEWIPALVNADRCDHLRVSGPGTLDGNGQFFYTAFWEARRKDPKVTSLAVERPRLAFIEDSNDVRVSGVRFENSGFTKDSVLLTITTKTLQRPPVVRAGAYRRHSSMMFPRRWTSGLKESGMEPGGVAGRLHP